MTTRGTTAPRQRLMERLDRAGREISASTIMFHTALAAQRGLSPTDTKALDILLRHGALTHADLVVQTSLAPATVTELIDRLQAKGYATRDPHPTDKRRVLISPNLTRIEVELRPLFGPWHRELRALYAEYTNDELTVIADFLSRAAVLQQEAAESLTATQRDSRTRRAHESGEPGLKPLA